MNGNYTTEIERCEREIAVIEAELIGGHPDVAGLCLALSDWSAELRILRGTVVRFALPCRAVSKHMPSDTKTARHGANRRNVSADVSDRGRQKSCVV